MKPRKIPSKGKKTLRTRKAKEKQRKVNVETAVSLLNKTQLLSVSISEAAVFSGIRNTRWVPIIKEVSEYVCPDSEQENYSPNFSSRFSGKIPD